MLHGITPRPEPKTWRHRGWRSCADRTVEGIMEDTPPYFRCLHCYRVVTHGQVSQGGACVCGWRKVVVCTELTYPEIFLLKVGYFRLTEWERAAIRPVFPWVGERLRTLVLKWA